MKRTVAVNTISIFYLTFALLAASPNAKPAEITMSLGNDGSGGNIPFCVLSISGEIVEGDSTRLHKILSDNPIDAFYTNLIELNSPGGSVSEAISISEIINRHRLQVHVPENGVCASACALIYLTAPIRIRVGAVSLHRPYFDFSSLDPMRIDEYTARQQDAIYLIRTHLMSRGISSSLVDKMMSLPSNSAYNLTLRDDYEIGTMSPMFEEFSINHCGLNNKDLVTAPISGKACVVQEAHFVFKALAYIENYGRPMFEQASSLGNNLVARGDTFNLSCGNPYEARGKRQQP